MNHWETKVFCIKHSFGTFRTWLPIKTDSSIKHGIMSFGTLCVFFMEDYALVVSTLSFINLLLLTKHWSSLNTNVL